MSNTNKTTVYMSDDTRKKLHVPPYGKRGTTEAMRSCIERYFALLDTETKRVKAMFTPEEWLAMYNATNGTIWEPFSIRQGMALEIEDSLPEEIASFGADQKTLAEKLKKLTPVQDYCLIEQVEAYWADK